MVHADGEDVTASEDVPALIARAQAGDDAAGAELLARYRPLMIGLVARCSRPLPGGAVAEDDLWQEGCRHFLELLRSYRSASPVSFGAYLKRKLGWRLANYVRAERRRQQLGTPLGVAHLDLVDDALRPDRGGLQNPRLRSALRQLSPKQRAVLYHLHWQGRAVAEIAASWGLTAQAVTATRRRAEAQLRKSMAEHSRGHGCDD